MPHRTAVLALTATAALAACIPAAGAARTSPPPTPRIVEVLYYEDTEDGKRYNVVADVARRPIGVSAKANGVRTEGRLSRHIGPGGGPRKGKSWFFRDKRFVKAFRADLHDDGVSKLKVWAANEGGVVRKRCTMVLEVDPLYGESAEGDCRRF
jgi:hypothetical protein